MEPVDRVAIFERLKHALQLLACAADIQLNQLPDFVCKGDELALDFDNWRTVALSNFRSEMTSEQVSRLDAIDLSLSELTRKGPETWTDESVLTSESWNDIRSLAAAALKSFGWTIEVPPSHAHEYVGRKRPPED